MPVRSGLVILFQEFPDECVTWRHIASSQLMWHLRLRGVVHRKGLSTNFRFSFQESHVLVALGSQTRRHMDSSGSATNNDNTLFLHVSKLQQLQQSQIDKLYQTVSNCHKIQLERNVNVKILQFLSVSNCQRFFRVMLPALLSSKHDGNNLWLGFGWSSETFGKSALRITMAGTGCTDSRLIASPEKSDPYGSAMKIEVNS